MKTSFFALVYFVFALFSQPIYAYNLTDVVRDFATGTQLKNNANQVNQQKTNTVNGYVSVHRGVEATKEWQYIYNKVVDSSVQLDKALVESGQDLRSCSFSRLEDFNKDFPIFENIIGVNLPKNQSMPTAVLDVNTFKALNDSMYNKNSVATAVYIPNLNSFNTFTKQGNRKNVAQNLGAIMIPSELAFAAKNQYQELGRTTLTDSQNLYDATMRDIATIGYFIYKNPQYSINIDEFMKSSLVLYARNKMMCIYDVQR
ncbi:hypothetical protein GW796_09415 [archaeon]|nr:hypothetical protein [archaeon]